MNKITLLGIDFHFGIGFLNELLDGTGLKLDELGLQPDEVLMPKIIFYSRLYAVKRVGKVVDFTIYDIHDLIEDNGGIGGKFWFDFKLAFNECMFKDVPKSETDSKKKVKAVK